MAMTAPAGTSQFDASREEIRTRIAEASGDPAAAKLIASMLHSYEAHLFRWLFLSFPNLPETAPDADFLGGFRALGQCTALRNLSLYSVQPVPMKGEYLSHLTNLVALSLDASCLPFSLHQAPSVAALLCAPRNQLKTLALRKFHCTAAELDAFTHSLSCTPPDYFSLRHVQLSGADHSDNSGLLLVDALCTYLPRLKSLHLDGLALKRPLRPCSSLRHLHISTRNTQPLLLHFGEMALHSLSLTRVTLKPVADFAAQLPPTLRWLRLAHTDLGDDGITTLCSAFNQGRLPDLQKLDLESNDIGGAGALALLKLLGERWRWQLEELSLRRNPIGASSVAAFEALMPQTGLCVLQTATKNLTQSSRRITIAGDTLAEELAKNKRLPARHRSRLASLPSDLLLQILLIRHDLRHCAPLPNFGTAGLQPSAKRQYEARVRKVLGLPPRK